MCLASECVLRDGTRVVVRPIQAAATRGSARELRRPQRLVAAAPSHDPRTPQTHLGQPYRREADYWAGQVQPGLDSDDAPTIAGLLHVASSPWLPAHMEQWARAWAASLEELTGGRAGN